MAANRRTPDEALLERLRQLPEGRLQSEVVAPLLRAVGESVVLVHGPDEGGKDFVYVTRDSFDEPILEVCQVKNAPFSTRASDSANVYSILTQLRECAVLEVTNPLTNTNELPHAATLITTYPLPQRATVRVDGLLRDLRSMRCRIVGPDKLLQLLRSHVPDVYNAFAFPGTGITRALLVYVSRHHESQAFRVQKERLLPDFYVDLSIATAAPSRPRRESMEQERTVLLTEEMVQQVEAFQEAIPAPLNRVPLLTVSRLPEPRTPGAQRLGQAFYMERLDSSRFLKRTKSELKKLMLSGTEKDKCAALGLLLPALALAEFVRETVLPKASAYHSEQYWPELPSEVGDVVPESLLMLESSLVVKAGAGAGKTSLARSLSRVALESGLRCVYFPCFLIEARRPLRDTIVEFLSGLSGDDPAVAEQYLDTADLLVLDGCDEAPTLAGGLSESVQAVFRDLCAKRGVATALGESDIVRIPHGIPVDVATSDSKPHVVVRPTWPLRKVDFERLRRANPSLKADLASFEDVCLSSSPRLVLTMRDEAPFSAPDTISHLTLAPFTNLQLKLFLKKWFSDNKQAQRVWRFLQGNPHVLEVCRRPIVATLLAAMHENGLSLPNSRSELYSQRFALLLGEWDAAKGLSRPSSMPPNEKLMLLSKLGLDLHRRKSRQFTKGEFVALWNDRLSTVYPHVGPDELLSELHTHNGVIQPEGQSIYSLGHLSFQEYLAARGAVLFQEENFLVHQFGEPWWRSVLVFYAGLRGDISHFLGRLHKDMRILSSESKRLAAEMLAEARFTTGEVRAFFEESDMIDYWEYDEGLPEELWFDD